VKKLVRLEKKLVIKHEIHEIHEFEKYENYEKI
jgi:hypothetical protein